MIYLADHTQASYSLEEWRFRIYIVNYLIVVIES